MPSIQKTKVRARYDTAYNFSQANPVLERGELATDQRKIWVGDGVKPFSLLDPIEADTSPNLTHKPTPLDCIGPVAPGFQRRTIHTCQHQVPTWSLDVMSICETIVRRPISGNAHIFQRCRALSSTGASIREFARRGECAADLDNLGPSSSIAWSPWFPLNMESLSFTKGSTVTGGVMTASISSGVVHFDFAEVQFSSLSPGTTIVELTGLTDLATVKRCTGLMWKFTTTESGMVYSGGNPVTAYFYGTASPSQKWFGHIDIQLGMKGISF